MRRLRLRGDLVAGPHPEDAARWLVFLGERGESSELPEVGWRLAEAFDGSRSLEEVAERVASEVEPAAVEGLARQLVALGILEPADGPPRRLSMARPQWRARSRDPTAQLLLHPEARFSCALAGTCCRSGYVIPLTTEEARAARAEALRVLPAPADSNPPEARRERSDRGREVAASPGPGPADSGKPEARSDRGRVAPMDPVTLVPAEHGEPWRYALDNEEGCPFLEARRCGLHETAAHPAPCRVFPLTFVQAGARVYGSVAHRCVCGALDRGEPLEGRRGALEATLRGLGTLLTVPEAARLDAGRTGPGVAAAETLARATEAGSAWAMLDQAVRGLSRGLGASGRREAPEELYERLAAVAGGDDLLEAALRGSPHPLRAMIRDDMRAAGLFDPGGDPQREAMVFIRDALFGLRPFGFETLAQGLLALGLGLARILRGLPARGAHPLARERVMLWEDGLASSDAPGVFATASRLSLEDVARQLEALEAWGAAR